MNRYNREIAKIKDACYSKQWQLDTVIGIKPYIDNHYQDDLNLDLFSRIKFVSKYHLLRLYKRYYGLTPKQYLIDKRVEMSKVYIRDGMSITEACNEVGFESLGSFSALFKRKTGFTPTEFQKSNFREVE
ncbi:AraC family transcriptional regulator [Halosquirtibacter xylanolyticus]|uniref:helix-turn-helix domain-containing protein n=1 Tax=Halosquirtibacter xylanolyticus TaxID=3374599 RepID=UPI003747E4A2|nr:AraC family transcriptional regulator [Prolixibacteraceae bacterium]